MSGCTTLVIEAGGTTLRAGLFDETRRAIIGRQTMPSPNYFTVKDDDATTQLIAAMRRLGDRVTRDAPDVVSVAYPGPIANGIVLGAPTVTGPERHHRFSLMAECHRLWPKAEIYTLNDLSAAGFRLAALGLLDFVVITIGSGVGHKVFVDGAPCVGKAGRGGEIGHLRLDFSPDAPTCDCGGRGHVGGLTSARGTIARARAVAAESPMLWQRSVLSGWVIDSSEISGPTLAAAYQAGDEFAQTVITDTVRYLGQAMAAIHLDTGVESFVLMGGFPRALGPRYLEDVAAAAGAASWDLGQDWSRMVRLGPNDDDSALIGAGLFARGLLTGSKA